MTDSASIDTKKEEEKEKTIDPCVESKALAEEYKSKYLRALADYQNYERRVQDQRMELIKGANKQLILKLLTFLDNLDRAELFVEDENLAHVKESFMKVLQEEGLTELDVVNKEYDPYTAEAIEMVAGKKENMVVEVLRKGYTYNGTIIRVAQVKVSKKTA